jgi:hypothetical protein
MAKRKLKKWEKEMLKRVDQSVSKENHKKAKPYVKKVTKLISNMRNIPQSKRDIRFIKDFNVSNKRLCILMAIKLKKKSSITSLIEFLGTAYSETLREMIKDGTVLIDARWNLSINKE